MLIGRNLQCRVDLHPRLRSAFSESEHRAGNLNNRPSWHPVYKKMVSINLIHPHRLFQLRSLASRRVWQLHGALLLVLGGLNAASAFILAFF